MDIYGKRVGLKERLERIDPQHNFLRSSYILSGVFDDFGDSLGTPNGDTQYGSSY